MNCFNEVFKKLREDGELAYGWQSSIAMAFIDEFLSVMGSSSIDYETLHNIANESAKSFIKNLTYESEQDKCSREPTAEERAEMLKEES